LIENANLATAAGGIASVTL